MAKSYRELLALSDHELVEEHDRAAEHLSPTVNYYLDELARRNQQRATDRMLLYTWWVAIMTGVVMLCTVVITWATLTG